MIELKLLKDFPVEIIAVDEVGRSPLSGPVVTGAVRVLVPDEASLLGLLRSLRRMGVKDSKQLVHADRRRVLKKLKVPDLDFREKGMFVWKNLEISFVTWELHHDVIDTENIFQASMRAMKESAIHVQEGERSRTVVLIDGQCKLRWGELECPWKEITIVGGDAKSPLIGLASIIAKEKRDQFMRDMHVLYPHYGFDSNFGYPTPFHRRAIAEIGPCPIHRKTFSKVKEFIPTAPIG